MSQEQQTSNMPLDQALTRANITASRPFGRDGGLPASLTHCGQIMRATRDPGGRPRSWQCGTCGITLTHASALNPLTSLQVQALGDHCWTITIDPQSILGHQP